jgi:hypothetical protein
VTADPRAGVVAQASALLAEAGDHDILKLPVLSAAELRVLCGDGTVPGDEAETRWWAGLTGDKRAALAAAVMDLASHRGLLLAGRDGSQPPGPADGTASASPRSPELAVIAAAWQQPSVVAMGLDGEGPAKSSPRLFGLAEDGQPPRSVVLEYATANSSAQFGPMFGPLHTFALLSVPRAARLLAQWATRPQPARRLLGKRGSAAAPRVVAIRWQGLAAPERVVVSPGRGGHYEVSRQCPDTAPEPAVTVDADALASQLAGILASGPR